MTADQGSAISKAFTKLYDQLKAAHDVCGIEDAERVEDCLGFVAQAKAIWDGDSASDAEGD